MAETYNLSQGSIERIDKASSSDDPVYQSMPTVQILTLDKLQRQNQVNSADTGRYRLIVSDGKHFTQTIMAGSLSHLADEGTLRKGSIVRLKKMSRNTTPEGKWFILLLQLDVLNTGPLEKIGTPVLVSLPANEGEAATSSSAAPAVSVPRQLHQQPHIQPQQSASTLRASAAKTSARNTCPISDLSVYANGRQWEICARVLSKSEIRHWSKQQGEGKVFNVIFGDETGKINAVGFNAAADKFYNELQEDKAYYLSKAKIQVVYNKKFSGVDNECEISLDERNTVIEECMDATEMPSVSYNFTALSKLETRAKDDVCDIIAIVNDVGEAMNLISKAGNPYTKRELSLIDESGCSIRLTLFGKKVEQYVHKQDAVVAFRGVKVDSFGGRSLTTLDTSSIDVDPDIPEARRLKEWFNDSVQTGNFSSYAKADISGGGGGGGGKFDRSQISVIADLRGSTSTLEENEQYFNCCATIVHIKDKLAYAACPKEGCNNKGLKQLEETENAWLCEKCGTTYEKPNYRYMISMSVVDHTGQVWLQGFHDVGLVVFDGRAADELMELKESDWDDFINEVQKATCKTYNFSLRAKMETFNGSSMPRYNIMKILPLNYKEEAIALHNKLFNRDGGAAGPTQ